MADEKVEYTKPTSQLDLEARLERDNENPEAHVVGTSNPASFGVEEYVGTDPIYQNHANDTEKPYAAEEGGEKVAEELFRESHESHLQDPPEAKEASEARFTTDPVEEAQKQHEANLKRYEQRQEEIKSDAAGPFAEKSSEGDELENVADEDDDEDNKPVF